MKKDLVKIGIPAFREREWLPKTLASLAHQDDTAFEVWVCVNQPPEYLQDPSYREITKENLETLAWLRREKDHFPFPIRIRDAVTDGQAGAGVGWARRFLFDQIVAGEPDRTVCISLDADTLADPGYVSHVREAFARYANAVALAAPYQHPLPEDPRRALHLLRYEIYMRYYQVSLWRIGSPYAFLALGSAMAFRVGAYRRIGGMPVRKAGEDFYFMQQLRKIGPVIRWLASRVHPSARDSDRVPFGTGPLMNETDLGLQETRFPFYSQKAFDLLGETFRLFPAFHRTPMDLPIDGFIREQMKGYDAFEKMRRNFPRTELFVKACHEKLDGLRTLQFLRYYHERYGGSHGSDALGSLLKQFGDSPGPVIFSAAHLPKLVRLRQRLAALEAEYQQNFMSCWDHRAKW